MQVESIPPVEAGICRADLLAKILRTALAERITIEQAKGALAQREGIGVEAALDLIRERARTDGRSVASIGAVILGTDVDG